MNLLHVILLASLLCWLSACRGQRSQTEKSILCTNSWYHSVELAIPSGDGTGHGPDIGSDEWKSVIEFRLGIRGKADVPDRNSQEWCSYINEFI